MLQLLIEVKLSLQIDQWDVKINCHQFRPRNNSCFNGLTTNNIKIIYPSYLPQQK